MMIDDDYYRKLWQNTAKKESSDTMGTGTNNSSPNWTASVLRRSTAHCSEIIHIIQHLPAFSKLKTDK